MALQQLCEGSVSTLRARVYIRTTTVEVEGLVAVGLRLRV